MPDETPFDEVSTTRERQAYTAFRTQPTWVDWVVTFVALMVLLGVAGALFVWGLLMAAALVLVAAVVWAWRAVRRRFFGRDSLRRGVRIVRRD